MKIMPENKEKLIDAAIGRIPCDLVIKNAQIVNVITGEIYKGSIGIYGKHIAHIQCDPDNLKRDEEELTGLEYYDAEGEYIIPGLIDAHVHIESSMMTPRNFAKAVIPHGTTTVVTDPHEIANVCGIDGVKYMHENSEDIPMRQFILAPSCVPAVPGMENAGAEFFADDMKKMLELDRVIGLAEVMDYNGVINNDKRMVDILKVFDDEKLFMQGHLPYVSGRDLSAYAAAGPNSCHESRLGQEARDKMRVGIYVDARESSISKNVADIVKSVKNFKYHNFLTLCTDDREPEDILEKGHMNDVVRAAVKAGLDPVDAIRCASWNIAAELGIKNIGAVAPGFTADLVQCRSLEDIIPSAVFFEGRIAAKDRKLLIPVEDRKYEIEDTNTVFAEDLTVEDFKIKVPAEDGEVEVKIISYVDQVIAVTNFETVKLPVKNGYIDISAYDDLKYVIVINRHKNNSSKALSIVRNFGTTKGAVGSTVSHDSHNMTIVYDNPENAFIVYKDLIELKGGMSCAADRTIKENLQLSVAGLISVKPCEELALEAGRMKTALRELGLTEIFNPLLRIVTLALPVIPFAKMSDMGMIDVLSRDFVPLFSAAK